MTPTGGSPFRDRLDHKNISLNQLVDITLEFLQATCILVHQLTILLEGVSVAICLGHCPSRPSHTRPGAGHPLEVLKLPSSECVGPTEAARDGYLLQSGRNRGSLERPKNFMFAVWLCVGNDVRIKMRCSPRAPRMGKRGAAWPSMACDTSPWLTMKSSVPSVLSLRAGRDL